MPDIKLIALDLDGTLLNSNKQLTPRCRDALTAAAAAGIHIVPCTGRFYGGMPDSIRELPFIRYVITINGAQVYDLTEQTALYAAEIPLAQAIDIMRFLDELPVIYDCYVDNWGRMTAALQEKAAEFAPDAHYLKMIRELRTPVPDLKADLLAGGKDIQKIMLFAKDLSLRDRLFGEIEARFPGVVTSATTRNNVEINHVRANKGDALLHLARHLGLRAAQTAALGDGTNDIPMIRAAGDGVAMANAADAVKAAADRVTLSCDEDGAAVTIEEYLQ